MGSDLQQLSCALMASVDSPEPQLSMPACSPAPFEFGTPTASAPPTATSAWTLMSMMAAVGMAPLHDCPSTQRKDSKLQ
jgi:hypothetical protein